MRLVTARVLGSGTGANERAGVRRYSSVRPEELVP